MTNNKVIIKCNKALIITTTYNDLKDNTRYVYAGYSQRYYCMFGQKGLFVTPG